MNLETTATALNQWMKEHQDELAQFTMGLMSINSETYHEKEAVEYLAGKMKEYGFDDVRIDEAGNCLGCVGTGPAVILADAHIDTVEPGDAEDWGFDPLQPRLADGMISGRGIIDDKGCLCAMVFAARAVKELGLDSEISYWVSGSISEEDVEGSCVKAMMELNPDIKPDMILVGEASEGRVIRGHKGRALIRMQVKGKAAHASAAWRGENALIKALPLISGIDEMQASREDEFLGKGSIEVTTVVCDTPSLNTIPGGATIVADRRISCGESKEELLEELSGLLALSDASATIDTEDVTTYTGYRIIQEDYFPSWVMPEDHPVVTSAVKAVELTTGKTPVVGKWDFCTNATYLCGITGIPSVGYGPGDESLCHGTEESLSVEELAAASSVYAMIPLCFAQNKKKDA